MVPIKDINEITITISMYMALLTTTLYTNTKPITTDAIKSKAAILSFKVGPFISLRNESKSAASKNRKQIKLIVFN